MKRTNTLRVLVMAAGVAAAMLAFSTRTALAEVSVSAGTASFDKVYGLQEGISPMSCSVGPGAAATWNCSTSSPLLANGADCHEDADVTVTPIDVPLLVPGCSASLSIVSWGGPAACSQTSQGRLCSATAPTASGLFSFSPVVGSPFYQQPAIISDASCNAAGGQANVTAEGVNGSGGRFSMTGTITWTGDCSTINEQVWAGQVTIA
jgi:hypothetical protein